MPTTSDPYYPPCPHVKASGAVCGETRRVNYGYAMQLAESGVRSWARCPCGHSWQWRGAPWPPEMTKAEVVP